jgi:GT2 family glycosyltransferase
MSIGIAIITCDRVKMFESCVESIHSTKQPVDHLIVVNDGEQKIPQGAYEIIDNDINVGVGESKNRAINRLIELGCEHLFLMEDDVLFKSEHALNKYIELSNLSGVKHLNFCLHGDANKRLDEPAPKLIIDYKTVRMALYHNVTGALSYYHRDVIEQCGMMDSEYRNAMEHVDHTMRIINAGFHPAFRWFADVADSHELIDDQDPSLAESKIRNEEQWRENFVHGVKLFHQRYGINVCSTDQVSDTKEQVLQYLRDVKP